MLKINTMAKTKEKGTTVDLRNRSTVYATATHPHEVEGTELQVGSLLVPSLVEKGFVTETAVVKKTKAAKSAEA